MHFEYYKTSNFAAKIYERFGKKSLSNLRKMKHLKIINVDKRVKCMLLNTCISISQDKRKHICTYSDTVVYPRETRDKPVIHVSTVIYT